MMPWSKSKIAGGLAASFLGVVSIAGCGTSSTPSATGARTHQKIVIGFSQSWEGNSYRLEVDKNFISVARRLKANGKISGYDLVNANNSVSTQISQIDDLILKHVSVLLIEPISATALNGAIAQAVHAHIPVIIVNDGPVTTPLAYELNPSAKGIGEATAGYAAQRMHGKGNLLDVLGIAGVPFNNEFQAGVRAVLKKYPHIKIVGEPYGNWSETTTESAVASLLPSLPTINAVISQGGESYGAVKAIQSTGRPLPLVVGGNRGYFLRWWWKEYQKTGYSTVSTEANPWVGGAAAYVAMDILDGKKVPKNMVMPSLTVTTQELPQYKNISAGGVAQKAYDSAWVQTHLLTQ